MSAGDRLAVVRHRHRAGSDQLTHFGERLTTLANGDSPDRIDSCGRGARALREYEADGRLIVGDRIGIRHRTHGGETAGSRGTCARSDGFDVLPAWLTQVAVHVDEARRDHETVAIDRLDTLPS